MNAAPLVFRYRVLIFSAIYILGFFAPWDLALHLDGRGPNSHLWALLAVGLAKTGALNIGAAFNLVLALGILFAFAAAWLRTWGSAWIGADVMLDGRLRGDAVVAGGPYRYLRNPLYLGTWCSTIALTLLMPASGAVFALIFITALELQLISSEEAFLASKFGEAYAVYCARVPRLLPALKPRTDAAGASPRWGEAILAEIFCWGVAFSFAALGWKYNAGLLLQCVLISFGVSLVARAFRPRPQTS